MALQALHNSLKAWSLGISDWGDDIDSGGQADRVVARCGGLVLKALLEALELNLPAASVLLVTVALPLGRLEESGFTGDHFVVRR